MEILKDMGHLFKGKVSTLDFQLKSEERILLCSTCFHVVKAKIFYLALDCGDGLLAIRSFKGAPTEEYPYICEECALKKDEG